MVTLIFLPSIFRFTFQRSSTSSRLGVTFRSISIATTDEIEIALARERVRTRVSFVRWEGTKKDSWMNQRFACRLRSNRLHRTLLPTKYIIARGEGLTSSWVTTRTWNRSSFNDPESSHPSIEDKRIKERDFVEFLDDFSEIPRRNSEGSAKNREHFLLTRATKPMSCASLHGFSISH